jgi:hypothetical protein
VKCTFSSVPEYNLYTSHAAHTASVSSVAGIVCRAQCHSVSGEIALCKVHQSRKMIDAYDRRGGG